MTTTTLRHPICPQQEYTNPFGTVNRTNEQTIDAIERAISSARRVASEGYPAMGLPPNPACLRLCLADIVAIIEGRI